MLKGGGYMRKWIWLQLIHRQTDSAPLKPVNLVITDNIIIITDFVHNKSIEINRNTVFTNFK